MSENQNKCKNKRKLSCFAEKNNNQKSIKRRNTVINGNRDNKNENLQSKNDFNDKISNNKITNNRSYEWHSPYLDSVEVPDIILKDHINTDSLIMISDSNGNDSSSEKSKNSKK